MRKVIDVKRLLSLDKFDVYDKVKSSGAIRFEDDTEIVYNSHEIKLIRFLLDPIVKLGVHQEVYLGSLLDIKTMYSNGVYTSKTIDKFLTILTEYFVRSYVEEKSIPKKILIEFYRYCYEMIDDVYNHIVYDNLEYVTDINIVDFIAIQDDPDLKEAMMLAKIEKSQEAVNNTYVVLEKVMRKEIFRLNPIAEGYIAGTMNPNQLKQMLGARGFVTEINNHIFNVPVTSSYVEGMSNIYEFAIDSRSGAKALYLTVVAVEKAEYLARELQLVTTIVEKVTDNDCGSKDYLDWYIRTPEENNGNSDLPKLLGKYYLDEETGKLKSIRKGDKHLEGKTIKLRHVMGCKEKNSKHVCQKCFGEMGYNLFSHNNTGYISTTHSSHKVTQNLISTKHLTQSAKAESLHLSDEVSKYFITKANNYYFRANVNFGKGTHKLIMEQAELNGLKVISSGNLSPDKINPARSSKLKTVFLEINNKAGTDLVAINLHNKASFGVLSKEGIKYIMDNDYVLDAYDRVVIDLEKWNTKDPLFYTPEVEFSYLDLANEIKSMFKAMKEDETPESLLQKFFDAVNTRLSINLSLLEVVVYGFTVFDYENGDFRLSRNSPKPSVRRLDNIIINRSLGVSYGWERLLTIIFNPKVYYGKNAISTPMDLVIKPNEVVNRYLTHQK